jgi:hypothetical protein
MKDRILKLFNTVMTFVQTNKWTQRLGVVGLVIGALVAVVAVFGLMVSLILGLIFVRVLGPGLASGFLSWLTWTYFGIGATYFSQLAPVYQVIPFWHLVFFWTTVIFIVRVLRKATYGSIKKPVKKDVAIK